MNNLQTFCSMHICTHRVHFLHSLLIRLLLWDCDDRVYSFYIDVSTDQKTWNRVADRTKQDCR